MTRDDLLAAHRVPPRLFGIVPSNIGGLWAADTAAKRFTPHEIQLLHARFLKVNAWLKEEVGQFKPQLLNEQPTRHLQSRPSSGEKPCSTWRTSELSRESRVFCDEKLFMQ